MQDSIYRPSRKGSISAPLHARSAGHYMVASGWTEEPRKKNFLELFWCIAGTGEFRCGNETWILNPGEVCFLFPGDCHDFRSNAPVWEYYWLTIDGPDPWLLIRQFRLKRSPRHAGNCPVEVFARLSAELRNPAVRGEFRAGAAAYEILSLAMGGAEPEENGRFRRFRTLLEDSFHDPELQIETIADSLGIHRSTLTRLVKRCCGMTPMEYLLSLRLQEALRLLNDTEYSIKEIAECTGFRDPNYFTKVISRRLGKPPSSLRSF